MAVLLAFILSAALLAFVIVLVGRLQGIQSRAGKKEIKAAVNAGKQRTILNFLPRKDSNVQQDNEVPLNTGAYGAAEDVDDGDDDLFQAQGVVRLRSPEAELWNETASPPQGAAAGQVRSPSRPPPRKTRNLSNHGGPGPSHLSASMAGVESGHPPPPPLGPSALNVTLNPPPPAPAPAPAAPLVPQAAALPTGPAAPAVAPTPAAAPVAAPARRRRAFISASVLREDCKRPTIPDEDLAMLQRMHGLEFKGWAYVPDELTDTGTKYVRCHICERNGNERYCNITRDSGWDRNAFTKHEATEGHKKAYKQLELALDQQDANTDLCLGDLADEALFALFVNCYVVSFHSMPFTMYRVMNQTMHFLKTPNVTSLYNDERALGRLSSCLAHVYEEAQANRMKNSTFIGIQMDEASCKAGESHAAICVTYDDPNTGKLYDEFFALVKLDNWTGRGMLAKTVSAAQRRLRSNFVDVAPGTYSTPALQAFFEQMNATNFTSYWGHTLTGVPSDAAERLHVVHTLAVEYANNLDSHLEARFPDMPFIEALALFDPAEYPAELENVKAWAEPKWRAIASYFEERRSAAEHSHACHPSLDVEAAKHEYFNGLGFEHLWEMRKAALVQKEVFVKYHVKSKRMLDELLSGSVHLFDDCDSLDLLQSANEASGPRPVHHVEKVYMELLSDRRGSLAMLLKLMLFCIMMKPTSVNCERVFSLRTLLKTDRRARLSAIRLGQCLWLKYNTSGDLEKEKPMLSEAVKVHKSKVNMQLFRDIAGNVENQVRQPSMARMH